MKKAFGVPLAIALGGSGAFAVDAYKDFQELCSLGTYEALPEPSSEAYAAGEPTFICSLDNPNCGDTNYLAKFYGGGNMIPTTLPNIDDDFELALISTEDRDFYSTNTIDGAEVMMRIAGRTRVDIKELSVSLPSGGSDLVMQYVRNYYRDAMPEKTWCRKAAEISIGSRLLENLNLQPEYVTDPSTGEVSIIFPGKAEILEDFVNIAYFGRGAWGVEAAAQTYFGKSSYDLSIIEGTFLAALIQSPSRMDGDTDADANARDMARLEARVNNILSTIIDLYPEKAAEIEAELAAKPALADYISPYNVYSQALHFDMGPAENLGAEHFVVDVRNQALKFIMEKYGKDEEEAMEIMRSGMVINTTLSENVQRNINQAVENSGIPQDGRQIAVVALRQDGSVAGMYGGDWENSQVNLATRPSPVGSSLKPYAYAWLEQNGRIGSLAQTFTEQPTFVWPGTDINGTDYQVDEGVHLPNNTGTGYQALAFSSNMVVLQEMQAAESAGLPALEGMTQMMRDFNMVSESPTVPSIILGGFETSTFSLATGQAGLVANQGVSVNTGMINSIAELQNGQYVDVSSNFFARPAGEQVVNPTVAADITEGMRDVVEYGTASGSIGDLVSLTDVAGKTGSAQDGMAAFFTGVAALEYGNMTISVGMRRVEDLHNMGANSNGGQYPAQIFGAIIRPMINGYHNIN